MRQQKFSNSSPAIGATKQQPLISGAISHRVSEYIDSITVELISPEVADEYLEHNTHNRPLSVDRVNLYAREMAEGRWQYNADTIRFDKNGVLLNGPAHPTRGQEKRFPRALYRGARLGAGMFRHDRSGWRGTNNRADCRLGRYRELPHGDGVGAPFVDLRQIR